MFTLDSEEALLSSFRPKDRAVVERTPAVTLPRTVRHYLAWTHPSGGRVYLVFAIAGGVATGIAFDTSGGAGSTVPQMCDWCHCVGAGQVALLTAQVNGKKRAGVTVCADLSCMQKLQDEADRTGASAIPALGKLIERIGRFANEALQIDLYGANR